MTGGGTSCETSAHIRVTWQNAIGRGLVSACYEDPATALRDAWTPALHPWNNTRVRADWEPSHEGTRRRQSERAPHLTWPSNCACGLICRLPGRHRAEENAEVAAAAAASPLIPAPGSAGDRAIAELPAGRGTGGPAWRPPPEILAAPRRGTIIVAAAIPGPLPAARLAAALGAELGGVVEARVRLPEAPGRTGTAARARVTRATAPGRSGTAGRRTV